MRINSKEELLNKKAEVEQLINGFTCRVLVCSGTGCMASGAQKIYDEMVRLCEGIDRDGESHSSCRRDQDRLPGTLRVRTSDAH